MGTKEQRVALVTGGSRGIGRAICERLAADGAFVIVNYAANEKAALDTLSSIEKAGGRAALVQADVGSLDGIHNLYKKTDEILRSKFDTARIDILINNAAVCWEMLTQEVDEARYDRLMEINLKAPFFLSQQVLGRMPDGGRIINISAKAAQRAYPFAITYSTSKHAITGFTRNLAAALGSRGITVNAVEAGFVPTDMFDGLVATKTAQLGSVPLEAVREQFAAGAIAMTAMGRMGEPAEIADVVGFFASHDARWVTGQVLAVDGGLQL